MVILVLIVHDFASILRLDKKGNNEYVVHTHSGTALCLWMPGRFCSIVSAVKAESRQSIHPPNRFSAIHSHQINSKSNFSLEDHNGIQSLPCDDVARVLRVELFLKIGHNLQLDLLPHFLPTRTNRSTNTTPLQLNSAFDSLRLVSKVQVSSKVVESIVVSLPCSLVVRVEARRTIELCAHARDDTVCEVLNHGAVVRVSPHAAPGDILMIGKAPEDLATEDCWNVGGSGEHDFSISLEKLVAPESEKLDLRIC